MSRQALDLLFFSLNNSYAAKPKRHEEKTLQSMSRRIKFLKELAVKKFKNSFNRNSILPSHQKPSLICRFYVIVCFLCG